MRRCSPAERGQTVSDVPEAQLGDPPRPVPAEEGEGTARTLSVHGRRVRVGGGTREQ